MIQLRFFTLGVFFLLLFFLFHQSPIGAQEVSQNLPENDVSDAVSPLQDKQDSMEESGMANEAVSGEKPSTGEPVEKDRDGFVFIPASMEDSAAGEEKLNQYQVIEGDTLWSISSSKLQDPFLWPKLWGANQDIANPDLIYPGLILRFPRDLMKTQEIVESPPREMAEPEKVVESVIEIQEEEGVEVEEVEEVQAPEEKVVQMPKPKVKTVSPKPVFDSNLLLSSGYILSNQTSTGVVVGALGHQEMLSQGDLIYIRPGEGVSSQRGDRLIVFKRVKKVKHPKTGAKMGELIRINGVLEVSSVQEETVSARIVKSFDAIFRGNEVTHFNSQSRPFSLSSPVSSRALTGYIVEVKEQKVLHGQHDIVYLDMGRQQGVSAGDRFNVTRFGKKTSRFSPGKGVQLPGYVIGQVEVIGIQESTATARILQTTDAVIKGDRVQTP